MNPISATESHSQARQQERSPQGASLERTELCRAEGGGDLADHGRGEGNCAHVKTTQGIQTLTVAKHHRRGQSAAIRHGLVDPHEMSVKRIRTRMWVRATRDCDVAPQEAKHDLQRTPVLTYRF